MDEKKGNQKPENFERVMATTLSLIANRGPEQVTISGVARLSKVSRAWIYKYIGSSKEDLIRGATLYIGNNFSSLVARPKANDMEELKASLHWGNERFVENLKRYPWIPILFFRFGHSKSLIGSAVMEVQNNYIHILASELMLALPIQKEEAIRFAGLYTSMRMGAAHWWTNSSGDESGSHLLQKFDGLMALLS